MSVLRRPVLLSAVVAVSLALALGACGSSNTRTVGTTHAVVGFAAHAGLAFGAFKLFVYDPYRAGKLGLSHPFSDAKAVAGALFAYHEVKTAYSELNGHPKLAHLARDFFLLEGALRLLRGSLSHGNTSAVSRVQNSISSTQKTASGLGSSITTQTSGIHL